MNTLSNSISNYNEVYEARGKTEKNYKVVI